MNMAQRPVAVDVAALRKVAEAADEGPWETYTLPDPGPNRWQMTGVGVAGDEMGHRADVFLPVYADHIATFDPPTVLAILDRLAEAEAKVARVEALVDDLKFRSCPCGLQLNAALTGGDR